MEAQPVIELHYLPSTAFLASVIPYNTVWLESSETFQKQTYRNRCYILTANKVASLSVPVRHTGTSTPVTEIKIDYSQNWVGEHLHALRSAYGKAPYFEDYFGPLSDILNNKPEFLFDLNISILNFIYMALGIHQDIMFTQHFQKTLRLPFIDMRESIHPKKGVATGIRSIPYLQLFGTDFVKNLSVVDLLFNEGPGSLPVLNKMSGLKS